MKVAECGVKNGVISIALDPLFNSFNCVASLLLMTDHGVSFDVMRIEG